MQNKGDRLIIFTRYPEPGTTKTRLIPVLGANGAADLQRQMTEHTLTVVKDFAVNFPISIAVCYTGKNEQVMQDWLGDDLTYFPQVKGDLGQRMESAFSESSRLGFSRIIIIGTDCPDLDQSLLKEAFESLYNYDLVLGEAADGGYYLIGLNQVIPELFIKIPWGTDKVLAITQKLAKELSLTCHILPILSDIDRPEDLSIWKKYR